MTDTTRQLCTFILDDQLFGIELEHVQEVVQEQPLVRVPLAPPSVRGLMNLRGEIVTVIDLRRHGAVRTSETGGGVAVVLRSEGGNTSLLVDEIRDIVDVDEASFELPPANLRGASRELIRGLYKTPGQLLLLLDLKKVLTTSTARNA